jgi:predicted DNA-binding transcriptional regulator YafY
MSEFKNPNTRYETLDKCFGNPGRKYTLEDLIIECEKALSKETGKDMSLGLTQIRNDIKFMENNPHWDVELVKEKGARFNIDLNKVTSATFIRYKTPNFSVYKKEQPLNETEANQLREALLTLGRFKGLPQYSWINELSTRLEADFNLKQESDVIISFDENENLKGLEFIPELYNAILYKKVLNIDYKSFKSENSEPIIISPHYLKQFNMRWFLFGKSNEYETITNLALDRIESIKIANQKYTDTIIDFNKYFDDIIGVTKLNVNIEHIIIDVVDKSLLPYLETKIIHVSQIIDDKYHIHLDVIPNPELESLILSFGEKVRVLEPQSLVEKLKGRIVKLKNNYLCT